jgi:4'-phosphopantetheinyl transferase
LCAAVSDNDQVTHALPFQDAARLCAATQALHARPGVVEVWAFELSTSPSILAQCRGSLSVAESARAERLIVPEDRDHFVVAHGVLRNLLARYTGINARDLAFSATQSGKPILCTQESALSFNLSHSQGRALIAVGDGSEIGIDLERTGTGVKALAIARRHFAPRERAAVEAAPPAELESVFFRYWVAKEAVLKGEGIGLRFPIDEFEIRFDPQLRTAQVHATAASPLHGDWLIRMLPVDDGWAAAVTLRGRHWRLDFPDGASAQ